MTVSTTTSRTSYAGNGITTAFAFPYKFLADADLVVLLVNANGISTTQVLSTNYTVSGAGTDSSGQVTMITPPASTETLVIYRETSITQETDYIVGDAFPAETHESALDKLTLIAQELNTSTDRALRIPDSATVSTELSTPEANKVVKVNSSATGFEYGALTVSVTADTDILTVDDVAALTLLSPTANSVIHTRGYYTPGDGGGATYLIEAAGASFDGYVNHQLANSTVATLQYSDSLNVRMAGAKGDGVTDDTLAIQAAVDTTKSIFFPDGTYLVGTQTAYLDGSDYGVGGIILNSGATLFGNGDNAVIKVKNSAYGPGALYGILRGDYVSDVEIRNLKFDGNSSNQVASAQCSNIYIHAGDNIRISNVYSILANGQSIQVVGKTTAISRFVQISDCVVDGATSIGIQVSQVDSPVISNNTILSCTNNAIDIYNEDGDATVSGEGAIIQGNSIRTALTGVFIETSSYVNCNGNYMEGCSSAGIHVNRINGEPNNSNITNNVIQGGPYSVRMSGVGDNNFITGNSFEGFTTAGVLLYGSNTAGVVITNNMFGFDSGTTYAFEVNNTNLSVSRAYNNIASDNWGGYSYNLLLTGSTSFAGARFEELKIVNTDVISNSREGSSSSIASGGTFSLTVPANSGGIIYLYGSSGGGWQSTASYSFVSDASNVAASKLNDAFVGAGQLFGAISNTGLAFEITLTATGSTSNVFYKIDFI